MRRILGLSVTLDSHNLSVALASFYGTELGALIWVSGALSGISEPHWDFLQAEFNSDIQPVMALKQFVAAKSHSVAKNDNWVARVKA